MRRIRKRYREAGRWQILPGSRRPKQTTARDERYLWRPAHWPKSHRSLLRYHGVGNLIILNENINGDNYFRTLSSENRRESAENISYLATKSSIRVSCFDMTVLWPTLSVDVLHGCSLGYLLIHRPHIATVMRPISFSFKYSLVSHTKSLWESREWNMVFHGNIWYHPRSF